MKTRIGIGTVIGLVVLTLAPSARAQTTTDKLNIQDTGIRVNHSAFNNADWVGITEASAGSYFNLSQFDLSGNDPIVISATLDILLRDWSEISSHNIEVYLLNQADEDWVETAATGLTKDGTNPWVGGSRPYDVTGAVSSGVWTPSLPGVREGVVINVTAVVQQMLDEGRTVGTFYITSSSAPGWDSHASMGQKEMMWDRPAGEPYNYYDYSRLIVTSGTELIEYILTVENGDGDGTYRPAEVVVITADAPAGGYAFKQWTGDTADIANLNAASTTIQMSATATITATYDTAYMLTVENGSGGGEYVQGAIVAIDADMAPSGHAFAVWVGDTADIADIHAASTTIEITPADATITATYVSVPWGDFTVYTTKDTYLGGYYDGRNYNNNYGLANQVIVRNPNYDCRAMFGGFDISEVGGTVASATLYMQNRGADSSGFENVTIYRLTQAWEEGTGIGTPSGDGATWNTYDGVNAWASGGGDFADDETTTTFTLRDTDDWYSIDVTAIVAYWQANPSENFGVILISNETNPNYTGTPLHPRQESPAYLDITSVASEPTYFLSVISGDGDGMYTDGHVATITADAPPADHEFDAWVGDIVGIGDINAASTTFTMGAAAASVTATYASAATYWPGDLNQDGAINTIDLNMVLIDWSKSTPNLTDPRSDGTGDGTVNVYDLNLVLIDWGKTGNP